MDQIRLNVTKHTVHVYMKDMVHNKRYGSMVLLLELLLYVFIT